MHLETARCFLLIVGIVVILFSRRWWLTLALPVLFFVPLPSMYRTKPGQIMVAEIDSPFFTRWVVDKKLQGESARVLYARGDTILAVVGAQDMRSRSPWTEPISRLGRLRHVLVLGAGAGLAATEFLRADCDDVEAVDTDARSFALAEKYFGYPTGDRRLTNHVASARDFLRSHAGPYDAIFVDRIAGAEISSRELVPHLAKGGAAFVRSRATDIGEVRAVFSRVESQELPRAESLITARAPK